MTDVLATRFAALADLTDDSDWLDVRRRSRRGRTRITVPIAAIFAAVVAAGAIAAGGAWVFTSHDGRVTARSDVRLGNRAWDVSFTTGRAEGGSFCARASSPGVTAHSICRGELGPGSSRPGSPFGALKLTVPGGQIWVGATVGFARRIAITDEAGVVHTAQALAAPKGTKTPFRYWVIAIGSSAARVITGYDARGRKITLRLG